MNFKTLGFVAAAAAGSAAMTSLTGCQKLTSDQADSVRYAKTYVVDAAFQDTGCGFYTLKIRKAGKLGKEHEKNLRIEFRNEDGSSFRKSDDPYVNEIFVCTDEEMITITKKGKEHGFDRDDVLDIEIILDDSDVLVESADDKRYSGLIKDFIMDNAPDVNNNPHGVADPGTHYHQKAIVYEVN